MCLYGTICPDGKRALNVDSRQGNSIFTEKKKGKTMADDDVVLEDEPVDPDTPSEDEETELSVLQEMRDDFRYFIKCMIPNSVYQDFEFPTSDDSNEGV